MGLSHKNVTNASALGENVSFFISKQHCSDPQEPRILPQLQSGTFIQGSTTQVIKRDKLLTDVWDSTDDSPRHYAESKKPDSKGYMVHIHGILEKARGKHIGGGQGLESGKEMTTKGHRGIFEGNRNLHILTLPVAALLNAFACLFLLLFVCLVWVFLASQSGI